MTAGVLSRFAPRSRWLSLPLRLVIVAFAAALVSGGTRGAAFDHYLASVVTQWSSDLEIWLASGYVCPEIAAVLGRGLTYVPVFLLLFVGAGLVATQSTFVPLVCQSWLSIQDGRLGSWLDIAVATSMPLSLGAAVARYDSISWVACGLFWAGYAFCSLVYDAAPGTTLPWRAMIRGRYDKGSKGIRSGR